PPPTGADHGPASGDDGRFRRYRWPLAAAAALVAVGVAAVLLLGSGSSSKSDSSTTAKTNAAPVGDRRSGKLIPVPTNRVTADGCAVLRLNGNVATVSVTTNKLLDGAAHALHIHAG